jgi:hypothetical protein
MGLEEGDGPAIVSPRGVLGLALLARLEDAAELPSSSQIPRHFGHWSISTCLRPSTTCGQRLVRSAGTSAARPAPDALRVMPDAMEDAGGADAHAVELVGVEPDAAASRSERRR